MKSHQSTTTHRTNLELANAVKIIHELEEELEIVSTRCSEQEEELFAVKNLGKDKERTMMRLEERVLQLENELQRAEFGFRTRLEGEK